MSASRLTLLPAQPICHGEQPERARWRREVGAQSLRDEQHILVIFRYITASRVARVPHLAGFRHQGRGVVQAVSAAATEARVAAVLLPARAARVLRDDGAYEDIGAIPVRRHL